MQEEKLKVCTGKCKQSKPSQCFNKNRAKKDGLNTICKECSALKSRQYYSVNKEKQTKQIQKLRKIRVAFNREYLFKYLVEHPCVDCGEKDPVVLEFDHIQDKKCDISRMLANGLSIKTIKAEISKCEVRCANCHRRKTAKDYNWYKNKTGS